MLKTTTFGHWLKQRRKALGLTQKALAQQAGCAEVTLRKIESGDLQPSAPLVTSLAQALRADEADLPALVALARGTAEDFTTTARLLRPQRPNNLPAELTPLIGRAHDITVVRRRLLGDGARLVTLVGPPGVGKTRLSLAVAEDVLEQFDDGAFFVRLGPISDPGQVAAAIAETLGLQMAGPNPPELQLRVYLEEKHLLLVLDNFEQVVAAAPLVDDLLRRCPWLHVLVTSRQPLRVRGERQIHVLPLALPAEMAGASAVTAADMLRYPAVELFAERAEAVLPDFTVDDGNAAAVAELCRRLDGLPLAIELVAARVKLLPPNELLTRLHGPWLLSTDGLRDVSARQKTLRGAIGWSYDLLTPLEQTLFTYLSIFTGGFILEAAKLLCGDTLSPPLPLPLSPSQVLDGIGSLLDKSLLHRETGMYGDPRYAMLETVREYGSERLTSGRQVPVLRERHARCFLHIIEAADQEEVNPRKPQLNRLIDDEIHNLHTALDWFKKQDVQSALQLTASLLHWFSLQGPIEDGRRMAIEALALPNASAHTISRAKTLHQAGILMLFSDEISQAHAYEEESLILSQELGYALGEADALLGLGRVANIGWYDQAAARQYLEQALAGYRALGDVGRIAYAIVLLGQTFLFQGDLTQAQALCEEALATAQEAGFLYPWPLVLLGEMSIRDGDLERALTLHEQALQILRQQGQQGSKAMIAYVLTDLGHIATQQGNFAAAHAFLTDALALRNELGSGEKTLSETYTCMAELLQKERSFEKAAQLYRRSLTGVQLDPVEQGPWLVKLATLAEVLGQYELAVGLLGASQAVEDMTGYPLDPVQRTSRTHTGDVAREQLGIERFDIAWSEGSAVPFVQIAEEAVSILEDAVRTQDRESSL